MLSVVETVNCTMYGRDEYEDECYITGTVYCSCDISGVPELNIPISYNSNNFFNKLHGGGR